MHRESAHQSPIPAFCGWRPRPLDFLADNPPERSQPVTLPASPFSRGQRVERKPDGTGESGITDPTTFQLEMSRNQPQKIATQQNG
jgi:hypothetical protein